MATGASRANRTPVEVVVDRCGSLPIAVPRSSAVRFSESMGLRRRAMGHQALPKVSPCGLAYRGRAVPEVCQSTNASRSVGLTSSRASTSRARDERHTAKPASTFWMPSTRAPAGSYSRTPNRNNSWQPSERWGRPFDRHGPTTLSCIVDVEVIRHQSANSVAMVDRSSVPPTTVASTIISLASKDRTDKCRLVSCPGSSSVAW